MTAPKDPKDDAVRVNTAAWVAAWQRAGKELEKIRLAELAGIETSQALQAFTGPFTDRALALPPRPSSGLVEQQRLFRLLRQK
ncbi:MAG: hypothetical protein KDD69_05030 [Bdellovibrionales bacterium]|nr:hypothetical protein [Bdellovibrionales bacterium]